MIILFVEDSPSAVRRIRLAMAGKALQYEVVSEPTRLDVHGLTGRVFDHPDEEIKVRWSEIRALFCDYLLPGSFSGADIVKAAASAGVPRIVGMSSSTSNNAALKAAGAVRVHVKPVVLGGLETGAFDSILQDPNGEA